MNNFFHICLVVAISLAAICQPLLIAQNESLPPDLFPNPKFEHLSLKDGLPENSVNAIVQDHLGFLWFGTQNGLVKYDGYSMTVYQPDVDDPHSISSRWINSIYEDKAGILWVGTYDGGLNRFDRKTNSFIDYVNNPNDSLSISSNNVSCIYEDNSGILWVGTSNGLNLLDRETKKFQKFDFHEGDDSQKSKEHVSESKISDYYISAIYEDRSTGSLYVGMDIPGLWMFDLNRKIFIRQSFSDDDFVISQGVIRDFHQAQDGSIWIASSRGLSHFDPAMKELKSYQAVSTREENQENDFYSVIEDERGFIWARHRQVLYIGLQCLNPNTGKFHKYRYNSKSQYSISTDWVWSLYEDRSGILWVGTWENGVNKWDRKKWKFKAYQHDPDDPNSLIDNRVIAVTEDRSGGIWVGTKGGLDRFDRDTGVFTHYFHNPIDDQSLSSNYITEIIEDPQESGVFWIGTADAGLNKFYSEKNISLRYQYDPTDTLSLNSDRVHSILLDHKGFLWVGTEAGVNKLDRFTGRVLRYEEPDISQNWIGTIYEDRSETLWIGTNGGGLNRFDRESGKFTFYRSLSKNSSHSSIPTLFEDSRNNFWVGTFTSGLHLFDRDKGISIRSFTEKEGIAQNAVGAILEDGSGNLWISTRNGLSKFNPRLNTFKNFGSSDGLPWDWFRLGIQSITTQNGDMILSGNNGLIIFNPDSVRDDPVPPQVVITNLSLFNKPDQRLPFNGLISELAQVELSYNQNDLRFEYVGLHFGEPEKNQYKYMLENFDNDWIDASTQRNATYTNLDAGEYVFKVSACNRDGVWNEEGASIKIVISPPWWETWWAYLFYAVFIISVLYGLRRYELNRVNWKNQSKLDEVKLKERAEIDKMKSRFFANISHEFRTPLTLILGPLEKIKPKTTEEEIQKQTGLIRRNASRLLSLVNQLLDLSKLEAGKLKLTTAPGNIVPFVKGIAMSFESIAEHKDISLKVKSSNDDIQLYFDRDKMAKILTNLLSNAFKFTPDGGEITAHINQTEQNSVEIKIRDTGIGISEDELPKLFDRFYQVDSSQTREHEGTGIGLALTKELVELHHGAISVDSKSGEWTEFKIELPVGRKHLKDEEIVEAEEPLKEDIIIDEEQFIPLDAEEVNETEVIDEDRNILLVVEDNADVREFIKDSLGNAFQIEEASNGEQGVRKAEQLIPDLIISDVMMPKMDGNELTKRLKNDEKTSHIPIILLTAKSEQESKLEGLETGADDYLTKPFDTKELQVRIKNLINIRKKLQEKFSRSGYIPKTEGKKLSNLEEQFMSKVAEVIENHISEEKFNIEQFAEEVYMSRMQLHRKLKALTGKSASLYVRSFRLMRAKKMIEGKQGNISEIAYSVGFSSPAYFAKCFKEEFGVPPSELPT